MQKGKKSGSNAMNIVSNNPSHIGSVDTNNPASSLEPNFSANFKILNIATLPTPDSCALTPYTQISTDSKHHKTSQQLHHGKGS